MMNPFSALKADKKSFILGNAWDVTSAKAWEKAGCQAVGTSSYALAATFGYADGENLPWDLMLAMVKRIRAAINLPFSVDIEGGYARDAASIAANFIALSELGVQGVNLEDSVMTATGRQQLSADKFAETVQEVIDRVRSAGHDMFINLRTDAFLLGEPEALQQSLDRVEHYEKLEVGSLFVPGVKEVDDIKRLVATELPINVLALPGIISPNELFDLGVHRVSTGNFVHDAILRQQEHTTASIMEGTSWSSIFE